tara:strand:- start:27 stop:278 length:252 start_codon:yes stop_codon:yes gene_type:complete
MEQILVLFGSFISLLLMVNAHFTRKTLEKISAVELRLVEYTTKHDATEERSKENKKEIEILKERVHSIKGAQDRILQHIESTQ